jgi:dTDP-4-amino-4,6-dideoxygalactose transaminase/acetyltransferase-like isoleucine patch superfamily enzyme/UDP-3-O-acyl-N-acetylglucosamine deacetylase
MSEFISKNVILGENVDLRGAHVSNVSIGDRTKIREVFIFGSEKIGAKIGKDCYIGAYCYFQGVFGLEIGDNVTFAPGVQIFTDSGPNNGPLLKAYPIQEGPVKIKDGAWICANAVILPGVTIGKNSIIGANSVVHTDVPDGVVFAGSPAKFVKKINLEGDAKIESRQTTIKNIAETKKGINVYTGEEVSVKFHPAPENTGIVFVINGEEIKATLENAEVKEKSIFVGTVGISEHWLAPIYALKIDNLKVEVNFTKAPFGFPFFENGSKEIFDCLKSPGIKEQSAPKKCLILGECREYFFDDRKNGKFDSIKITPAEGLEIAYRVYYPHKAVGEQWFSFKVNENDFAKNIVEARSPAFVTREGTSKYAISEKTHLLIGSEEETSSRNIARYNGEEFVRHKILDFLGALALSGLQLKDMRFEVNASGHEFDLKTLKELKKNLVEIVGAPRAVEGNAPVKKSVPFLNLKKQNEPLMEEIMGEIRKLAENNEFILGKAVENFEKKFAEFIGAKHAVAVNSGTGALHLALLAFGIKAGDEVITTPYTFFATTEAILYCGAKPVFVDIDPETFTINTEKIEEKITSRTKAILPVHLYGQCANMEKISEIAAKHNLIVIEDACQAHGAELNGVKAGNLGHAGAFSFYPTKNLSGWGEGGIITTNSDEAAEKMRMYRSHGSKIRYVHEAVGYNERMDGIQGAVLGIKLKHLPELNNKRRNFVSLYRELLKDLPVILPREIGASVYHLFTIRAGRRDELKKFLAEHGIETAIHYEKPLHFQTVCADFGYKQGDFPEAERASKEVLSLPLYPEMSEDDVRYVVEKVREFYK